MEQKARSVGPSQLFAPSSIKVNLDQLADTRQRPFKSLVTSFSKTLLYEALHEWYRQKMIKLDSLPSTLSRDRPWIENFDFDQRQLKLQTLIFDALGKENEKDWLRQIKSAKK